MSSEVKRNWRDDARDYLLGAVKSFLSSMLVIGLLVWMLITSPSHMTIEGSRYLILLICFMCWQQGYGEGFYRGTKWDKRLLARSEQPQQRPASMASPVHLHWLIFILFMLFIGIPWIWSMFFSGK